MLLQNSLRFLICGGDDMFNVKGRICRIQEDLLAENKYNHHKDVFIHMDQESLHF